MYIYTGDATPPEELASRAHELFGVPPLRPVRCVRLRLRSAVLASRYPVATLAGQAAGSMLLGAEALAKLTPELFIDTAVRRPCSRASRKPQCSACTHTIMTLA